VRKIAERFGVDPGTVAADQPPFRGRKRSSPMKEEERN
jgi:hypothetical protein